MSIYTQKTDFTKFISQYDPAAEIAKRNAEAKAAKAAREKAKRLKPFVAFLQWADKHPYGPQNHKELVELADHVNATKYDHKKGEWVKGNEPIHYQRGLQSFAKFKIFHESL